LQTLDYLGRIWLGQNKLASTNTLAYTTVLLVTAVEGFRVHILHPEFDEKDVEIKLLLFST
jgi:hypothetical protein